MEKYKQEKKGDHHYELKRSHSLSEVKDIKLKNELAGNGSGKGSHRRKGANNKLYRDHYDSIFRKNKNV